MSRRATLSRVGAVISRTPGTATARTSLHSPFANCRDDHRQLARGGNPEGPYRKFY